MLVTISSLLQGLIMNGWEYIEEVSLMITLLMVSAFCSAAETAYSAANRQKIEAMCEGKKYGAKLAGKLQDRFDDVLSSILIANTIVCIALSSVGAIVFGEIVGSDECGAAISGALLTVSILLFGEISPKLMAKESSEKTACYLALPLYIMTLLLKPLCLMIVVWKSFLMKILKISPEK